MSQSLQHCRQQLSQLQSLLPKLPSRSSDGAESIDSADSASVPANAHDAAHKHGVVRAFALAASLSTLGGY